MCQNMFAAKPLPWTCWGNLQHSQRPLAGFGGGEGREEGKGWTPKPKSWLRPWLKVYTPEAVQIINYWKK